jgi:hypothetical protein
LGLADFQAGTTVGALGGVDGVELVLLSQDGFRTANPDAGAAPVTTRGLDAIRDQFLADLGRTTFFPDVS